MNRMFFRRPRTAFLLRCVSVYGNISQSKTDDNRETIISLTENAGKELHDIAKKCFDMFLEEYKAMTPQQQQILEEGLEHFDKLVSIIKTEGKII